MTIGLSPVTTLTIQLGPKQIIGQTPRGLQRISPILSGTAVGPRLNGIVLPGGDDWNLVLADGSIGFHARYTVQADDGTLIMVTNIGLEREVMARMFAGERIDPTGQCMVEQLPVSTFRMARTHGSGVRSLSPSYVWVDRTKPCFTYTK